MNKYQLSGSLVVLPAAQVQAAPAWRLLYSEDGVLESPPSITTQTLGSEHVAVLNVPESTGGAIFRPTASLPDQYRVEYKLKTIDFGGKRNGSITYGGRINGYNAQHP